MKRFFCINFKNIFSVILLPLFLVGMITLANLVLINTNNFKLDQISYSINQNNKYSYFQDEHESTILKIFPDEPQDPLAFNMLYANTYYNVLNGPIREMNSTPAASFDFNIHLETQYTFSIEPTLSTFGGYRLDNGLYHTYFSDDILGHRGYLIPRFQCQTFIFISDTFADKLLEKYNLPNGIEGYKELILNPTYAVLPIEINNHLFNFCINNVIYTNLRNAPRTYELYGDFALFCFNNYVAPAVDLHFEIDLKDNPYCISQTLLNVNACGYSNDNASFEFYCFNYESEQYVFNEKISKSFVAWNNDGNDSLYLILFLSITIFTLIFVYYYFAYYKAVSLIKNISLLLSYAILFVLGVVTVFAYNYMFFTIIPLCFIILTFILKGKELLNGINKNFFKRCNPLSIRKNSDYFEIKI